MWTDPDSGTINVGDVGTAAWVNTYVRDNLKALSQYGTALPTSPANNDRFTLVDDVTNPTYQWTFRYNAGSSSAHKWELIGGTPLFSEVTASDTTSSTSYAAIGTAGPSVSLPVAGDYDVEIGCTSVPQGTAVNIAYMSYDIGATGAVDADCVAAQQGTAATGIQQITMTPSRKRRKIGLTAVTLTAKYRSTGSAVGFSNRWMSVMPIRVG
jgi:hypothetical protein